MKCKYCEKEMLSEINEEYKKEYFCDCKNFLEEKRLMQLLENNKREQMQIKDKIRSLSNSSNLSKKIIEINQTFGVSLIQYNNEL